MGRVGWPRMADRPANCVELGDDVGGGRQGALTVIVSVVVVV